MPSEMQSSAPATVWLKNEVGITGLGLFLLNKTNKIKQRNQNQTAFKKSRKKTRKTQHELSHNSLQNLLKSVPI